MISRNKAMEVLKQLEYERFDVAPSADAYRRGIFTTVYFAVGPRRWYAYGSGTIDGWIGPWFDLEYPEIVASRIGYRGIVELFSPQRHTR